MNSLNLLTTMPNVYGPAEYVPSTIVAMNLKNYWAERRCLVRKQPVPHDFDFLHGESDFPEVLIIPFHASVKIRTAAFEQAVFVYNAAIMFRKLGRMAWMDDFDAVEPDLDEVKECFFRYRSTRMSEKRKPSRLRDELHGIFGSHFCFLLKSGAPFAYKLIECLLVRRSVPAVDQSVSNMRTTNRRALRVFKNRFDRDRHFQLVEFFHDACDALQPFLAEERERLKKMLVLVVDEITENMNLHAFVRGAEFSSGDDFHPLVISEADRFVERIDAVVVGDTDDPKADTLRFENQVSRRERSVGFRCVRMKICPCIQTILPVRDNAKIPPGRNASASDIDPLKLLVIVNDEFVPLELKVPFLDEHMNDARDGFA